MTLKDTFCVFPDYELRQQFTPFNLSPADPDGTIAVTGNPGGDRWGAAATLRKAIAAGAFPQLYRIKGRLYARNSDLAAHDASLMARLNGEAA